MATRRPTFIVGIGGSAGALKDYNGLLEALPSRTGMTFVIISHITPDAVSELASILSRHTEMKVLVAINAMPILADHVYVIPSDSDLFVDNHAFKVISPRSARNVQIDLFFNSIAEALGARAIGIVLSGYDGDGAKGCKHIKSKGGTTFAQDSSAEVNVMPLAAQASGFIDFVLPVAKIAETMQRMAKALKK
jgi:two-component system CheB/CheR fusion protein